MGWFYANVPVALLFGVIRIAGVLGVLPMTGRGADVYKSLAHCYVGLLFGLGIGLGLRGGGRGYLRLAWALTIVEIAAFLVTRVYPWWTSTRGE